MHPGFVRTTELDRTSYPEFRDGILEASQEDSVILPRGYPGYPRVELGEVTPRLWPSLDKALMKRHCARNLSTQLPSRRALSRILKFSHGASSPDGRGPTPSAGGLQALELYLVSLEDAWIKRGLYHFDRAGHHLSILSAGAERNEWEARIPSMAQVSGGALFWILAGDVERVATKYGERGYRFLLLEAGHLMQNLCLLSAAAGLCTVPLGGCFERELAAALSLPAGDAVLYAGVCGKEQH